MILAATTCLALCLGPQAEGAGTPATAGPPLQLEYALELPGVAGRIDHLALDPKRDLLYLAALGNDSLELVDLAERKRAGSVSGLSEPQGVLYLATLDVLLVANGGSGRLDVYSGETHEKLRSVPVGGDADNLRCDADEGRVLVAHSGAVEVLDPRTWEALGRLSTGAHPEGFELDPRSPRVFVNVPGEGSIAVGDRESRALLARWPIEGARANYPMKLLAGREAADERLLVGCRSPARLLVYDPGSGERTALLELSGDVDDLCWDARHQRVYASCGEGFIDVFERRSPDALARVAKVPTRRGARTALFVPDKERLYLAVPQDGEHPAELRVFVVLP